MLNLDNLDVPDELKQYEEVISEDDPSRHFKSYENEKPRGVTLMPSSKGVTMQMEKAHSSYRQEIDIDPEVALDVTLMFLTGEIEKFTLDEL